MEEKQCENKIAPPQTFLYVHISTQIYLPIHMFMQAMKYKDNNDFFFYLKPSQSSHELKTNYFTGIFFKYFVRLVQLPWQHLLKVKNK